MAGVFALLLLATAWAQLPTGPTNVELNAKLGLPAILGLGVSSGPVGTTVTITGANFGQIQGASTVTFNGTVATVTVWSVGNLTTTVPSGATTGNVVVTVAGTASNGSPFTVTLPDPAVVFIISPTTNPTYDAGTSATLTTLAGEADSAPTAITGCTWTNSLGGSGSATGTESWSVASIPLTVGSNVLTVSCANGSASPGTDVITVTRASAGGLVCTTTVAPGRTAVNAAITAAASGATICVSSGAATWTSRIDLPGNKNLTLAGHGGTEAMTCTGTEGTQGYSCAATASPTTLTCNDGCFDLDTAATIRITGFTMTNGNEQYLIHSFGANQDASDHFRIDHNRLISTAGGWTPIKWFGGNNGVHPQGIWDHNHFDNVAAHTNGTNEQMQDACGGCQDALWFESTTLGDSSRVVYFEGNYYTAGAGNYTNFGDGNYGARTVHRFNTTNGDATAGFEFHSPQGDNRGYRRWEFYNNTIHNLDISNGCFWGGLFIRGGTGVAFNNALTGDSDGCFYKFVFDNVRSNNDDPIEVAGLCDGSSAWDQNTSGQQGWHCRDQIGIGGDLVQWVNNPPAAWNQILRPAYVWNNVVSAVTQLFAVNIDHLNATHIQANRDYYDHSTLTANPQTVGVRSGTKATMTALNCTTGVAFWVTDEGEWNSTNGATADGRLYKCTSTNTWTLYYTPYDYPHPWTS